MLRRKPPLPPSTRLPQSESNRPRSKGAARTESGRGRLNSKPYLYADRTRLERVHPRSRGRRGRSSRSLKGEFGHQDNLSASPSYRRRSRRRYQKVRWKGLLRVVVRSTLNNLFLTASAKRGELLHRLSVGSAGFVGPRRPAPLSAEQTARQFAHQLLSTGFKKVEVRLPTLINSRVRKALYGLEQGGLWVRAVRLVPPVAHNGVRSKKARRS